MACEETANQLLSQEVYASRSLAVPRPATNPFPATSALILGMAIYWS